MKLRALSSFVLAAWLAASLAACGDVSPDASESTESGIMGGASDTGHPSVGVLRISASYNCTATLIDSRTLITAAHCFHHSKAVPHPTGVPRVRVSSTSTESFERWLYEVPAGATFDTLPVDSVVSFGGGNSLVASDADIAVARLSVAATDHATSELAAALPSTGATVTAVGFGCDRWTGGANGYGSNFLVKRMRTLTWGPDKDVGLAAIGVLSKRGVNVLCPADSGGPLFADERIVAVAHGGFYFQPTTGYSAWTSTTDVVARVEDAKALLARTPVCVAGSGKWCSTDAGAKPDGYDAAAVGDVVGAALVTCAGKTPTAIRSCACKKASPGRADGC